jgi:hypothetical protein
MLSETDTKSAVTNHLSPRTPHNYGLRIIAKVDRPRRHRPSDAHPARSLRRPHNADDPSQMLVSDARLSPNDHVAHGDLMQALAWR